MFCVMRVTSSRSSTRRASWFTCRSMISCRPLGVVAPRRGGLKDIEAVLYGRERVPQLVGEHSDKLVLVLIGLAELVEQLGAREELRALLIDWARSIQPASAAARARFASERGRRARAQGRASSGSRRRPRGSLRCARPRPSAQRGGQWDIFVDASSRSARRRPKRSKFGHHDVGED